MYKLNCISKLAVYANKTTPRMITDNTRSISLVLRKPFFESYLRYLFKTPTGPIKVSRTEEMGKYIYSRVRYSPLPIKKSEVG